MPHWIWRLANGYAVHDRYYRVVYAMKHDGDKSRIGACSIQSSYRYFPLAGVKEWISLHEENMCSTKEIIVLSWQKISQKEYTCR